MRPVYESTETLEAEARLAKRCSDEWRVRMVKLPFSYQIDFAIDKEHQPVKAWAEVKCRNCPRDAHASYIISLLKWDALMRAQELTDLPSYIVFGWTCGAAGWIRADRLDRRITISGRTDRNDPADIEPVLWIGRDQFKPLSQFPIFAFSGSARPA